MTNALPVSDEKKEQVLARLKKQIQNFYGEAGMGNVHTRLKELDDLIKLDLHANRIGKKEQDPCDVLIVYLGTSDSDSTDFLDSVSKGQRECDLITIDEMMAMAEDTLAYKGAEFILGDLTSGLVIGWRPGRNAKAMNEQISTRLQRNLPSLREAREKDRAKQGI